MSSNYIFRFVLLDEGNRIANDGCKWLIPMNIQGPAHFFIGKSQIYLVLTFHLIGGIIKQWKVSFPMETGDEGIKCS